MVEKKKTQEFHVTIDSEINAQVCWSTESDGLQNIGILGVVLGYFVEGNKI